MQNWKEKLNLKFFADKKNINIIYLIFIIGTLIIVGVNIFKPTPPIKQVVTADNDDGLESRLVAILSKIEGAGSVSIMVTYESSAELVPAVDKKETVNGESGDVELKHVIVNNSSLVLKEIYPKIKGAIIVCEGGEDPKIQKKIKDAVGAVLTAAPHNIIVVK